MGKPVKILAETSDDLRIVAAMTQDAILQVGEIVFDPNAQTFTLIMLRFMHESNKDERIGSSLRFYNVLDVKMRGINRTDPKAFMVLLDMNFLPAEVPPSGVLSIICAGGGEIRLECEALEVQLFDFRQPRKTRSVPKHPDA